MDSYTITITPNDDSGNHTTLTVDTSTGHARITTVHLHAPDGLTGGQMPNVDVGLLLQAVTGATRTPTAITATPAPAPPAPSASAPLHADTQPTDAGKPSTPAAATPQPATTDTAPPAPAAKRTNPRRAATARTTPPRTADGNTATTGTARRNQPTTKKAAPKKATRKQPTAAAAAGAGTERVYRRMPDDFAAMYRQASTAAAIADHYGVPRYTAHSWISRLKKQSAATEH